MLLVIYFVFSTFVLNPFMNMFVYLEYNDLKYSYNIPMVCKNKSIDLSIYNQENIAYLCLFIIGYLCLIVACALKFHNSMLLFSIYSIVSTVLNIYYMYYNSSILDHCFKMNNDSLNRLIIIQLVSFVIAIFYTFIACICLTLLVILNESIGSNTPSDATLIHRQLSSVSTVSAYSSSDVRAYSSSTRTDDLL
jgi:hypothetical protein